VSLDDLECEDDPTLLPLRGVVLSAVSDGDTITLFYPHGKTLTICWDDNCGMAVVPNTLPEC
jgi:hypothetical protein